MLGTIKLFLLSSHIILNINLAMRYFSCLQARKLMFREVKLLSWKHCEHAVEPGLNSGLSDLKPELWTIDQ